MLAIDSRARVGFAAAGFLGRVEVLYPRDPARPLADLGERAAELLRLCGEPDGVGVVTGPGGVVAVRGGVAFARAFAMARSLPAVGVTVFAAVEASVDRGESPLIVAEPMGRGHLAVAEYGFGEAGEPQPRLIARGELLAAGVLVAGLATAEESFGGTATGVYAPTPEALAGLVVSQLAAGAAVGPESLFPLYLRDAGARRSYEVRGPDGVIARVGDGER